MCALRHRDSHTQMHSERVVALSEVLGQSCALTHEELEILKLAACFHDIGKIGIPDSILLKPGKLSPEEWQVMQCHSLMGEEILRQLALPECDRAALAVRSHHEGYDGSGYPDQLKGEDIPVFARIIKITDSYDAMTETRPYHTARSHIETMEMLNQTFDGELDPYVMSHFETIIKTSRHRAP